MVIGISENTDIGDAATTIAGHVVTRTVDGMRDQDVSRVTVKTAGILGGHVDVERRQVFRDPVPDVNDAATFRIIERGW